MCGGYYEQFQKPKALYEVNGETLIHRTIKLLRMSEINNNNIFITADDKRFEEFGVKVLHHKNSYRYEDKKMKGYWLDAFYPDFKKDTKVTYLYGDVYYTKETIKKIINNKKSGNVLAGTRTAMNKAGKNWGEPFAYIVNNYESFLESIEKTKTLYDEGKTNRHPITWELYRVENGFDVNVQKINPESYIPIDDETSDVDAPFVIEKLEKRIRDMNTTMKVESVKQYFDIMQNTGIPAKRIFTVTRRRAKELEKAGVVRIIEEGECNGNN